MQPELPQLKEQGVDLYVIAAGRERDLKAFFEQNKLESTVIWDQDLSIFRTYQVDGVPASYFLDKQGRIRDHRLGWGSTSLAEFKDIVKVLSEDK